ncbi:histidine kinase [Brasilonema sp. CT11]|nr:histidine kinase [Brasilonema sp. CT11]
MQSIINRFPLVKSPYHRVLLALACVGLFVVPALFVRVTSSRNRDIALTWKAAQDIVPASLIQKTITQNSTGGVDANKVKVLQVPNRGKGALFIFDFQSPQLCGAGGCLYAVYHESGSLLLNAIANPKLPKGEALFKVDDVVRNSFSCLVITQTTTTPLMVSRTQYCYQGTGFVRVYEELTPMKQSLN